DAPPAALARCDKTRRARAAAARLLDDLERLERRAARRAGVLDERDRLTLREAAFDLLAEPVRLRLLAHEEAEQLRARIVMRRGGEHGRDERHGADGHPADGID